MSRGHAPDIFICTETLEHVENPQKLVKWIGQIIRGGALFTTPLDEPLTSDNEEHYWSWSMSDLVEMIENAGMQIIRKLSWRMPHYRYAVIHAVSVPVSPQLVAVTLPTHRWPE
jgi:2-polyprenyl-3-methyl-5-hydroxy-6-metoxy-1,4-benzoquinol methylase